MGSNHLGCLMRATALFAVTLISAAFPSSAAELTVHIMGENNLVSAVSVSCVSSGGEKNESDLKVDGSGVYELELDTSSTWTVSVSAPGFWTSEQVISASSQSNTIEARLWPVGHLKGKVTVEEGESLPETIAVRFEASPDDTPDFPDGEIPCPVEEGSWSCTLPAGTLDLRLRARGFISKYLWGLELPAGKDVDIGIQQLQRGASVVGWVIIESDDAKLDQCTVELTPVSADGTGAVDRTEEQRMGKLLLAAKADSRGFFHIQGVRPGSYELKATYKQMAPARFFPVMVMENAESALMKPVTIEAPATLEIQVSPTMDMWGQGWNAVLDRRGANPSFLERIDTAQLAEDGFWMVENLSPGSYVLGVADEDGNRWASEELEVASGINTSFVDIPLIPVIGTVTHGKEPLPATLWFGGHHGSMRVRMHSNEAGELEGYLPRTGSWDVTVASDDGGLNRRIRSVEVRKSDGSSKARVDIVIPNTVVTGRVLDQNGDPVALAKVEMSFLEVVEAEIPVTAITDEEGRFRSQGLPEGEVLLEAQTTSQRSDPVVVRVVSGEDTELTLVLRDVVSITGVVHGSTGGVPGASILAIPFGRIGRESYATTDVNGEFEIRVPHWAKLLNTIIMVPGYGLLSRRLQVSQETRLEIAVPQQAGTVLLSVPPVQQLSTALVHDGVIISTGLLMEWAARNGLERFQVGEVRIPLMEAGEYYLCRLKDDDIKAAFTGQLPQSSCLASGTLLPGSTLRLSITATGE